MLEVLLSAMSGGTVAILLKWAFAAWKRRADFKKLLGHIDLANESLRRIVNETGAKRAVIVAGHNGDGVPRLGKHVKTSVLYEYRAPGEGELKPGKQDVIICPVQTKYLIQAFTEYFTTIITDALPESTLKDTYVAHHVNHADVFFLFQEKTRWYYLEVHVGIDTASTEASRETVREEVNKLSKLFKGEA